MKINKKILSSVAVGALIFGPSTLVNAEEIVATETGSNGQDFMIAQDVVAEGSLKVMFVDGSGNELRESVVLTGAVGSEYHYDALDIPDYYLVDVQGTPNGIYQEGEQKIIYTYEELIRTGEVGVSYVDEDGYDVGHGDIYTGNVGEEYNIEAKEFEGYELVEIVGNQTGVYNQEYPEVTFIYRKQEPAEGIVEISFLSEDGSQLHEDVVLSGEVGTEYHYDALDIPDYFLAAVHGKTFGTFDEIKQKVTFIYSELIRTGEVGVSYVDEDGYDLGAGDIYTGNVGEEYNIEAKEFEGYELVEVVGEQAGVYNQEYPEVTFIYRKQEPVEGTVQVNFVDENGNQIKASEYLKGEVGSEYTYYPTNIQDFIITKFEGDITGTFTDEQQIIDVVYGKTLVSSEIQVSFIDQIGNDLAPSEIVTGIVGEDYVISPKEISDYYLIDTFGMERGKFDHMQRGVTFVYAKQEPITITNLANDVSESLEDVATEEPELVASEVQEITENNVSTTEQESEINEVQAITLIDSDGSAIENDIDIKEITENLPKIQEVVSTQVEEIASPDSIADNYTSENSDTTSINEDNKSIDIIKGEPKSTSGVNRADNATSSKI